MKAMVPPADKAKMITVSSPDIEMDNYLEICLIALVVLLIQLKIASIYHLNNWRNP